MEINVKKRGKNWMVEFTHGVQTFTLDYHVTEKDEACWMKDRLTSCFISAFGENWHENSGLNIPLVMQRSEPLPKQPVKTKGHKCDCTCPDCKLLNSVFGNGA